MRIFQRKTTFAIFGVAVISIFTTAFIMISAAAAAKPNTTQAIITTTNVPTATATSATDPTATATSATEATVTPTLTVTVITTPTATATRTATPTPAVGQQVDWTDSVSAIHSSSFTLRTHQVTVDVTAQTVYTGVAQSLSQMTRGMRVEVIGVVQNDGSVLASTVRTPTDN
jgi:hypothetical protein